MKIRKSFYIALLAVLALIPVANAQVSNNTWKVLSNILQPVISTWTVRLPYLGGNGTLCLQTDNDGDISAALAACGSGSGGSKWATSTTDSNAIYPAGATKIGIGSTTPAFNFGVAGAAMIGSTNQAVLGDSGIFVGSDRCAVIGNHTPLDFSQWQTGLGCGDKAIISQLGTGSGYYFDVINLDSGRALRAKGNDSTVDLGDASYALSVTGNNGVYRPVIFNAGNVGIGTSSPYAKLSVVGASGVVAGKFHATSTTGASIFEGTLNVGSNTGGAYRLNVTTGSGMLGSAFFDGGTQDSYINEDDNGLGGFYTTNGTQSAGIVTAGGIGGAVGDSVFRGGNTLFINGAKVGIATTTPYAPLSVVGLSTLANPDIVTGNIHATSTTATSTFSGGISVGTISGSFGFQVYKDGKVRIGNGTPSDGSAPLAVESTAAGTEVRLGFFNTTSATTRSEFTWSNSANVNWTNNFCSGMVHGGSYATNNYLGTAVGDAGLAMVLCQGASITNMAIGMYNSTRLILATNNTVRMTIEGGGNVAIGGTSSALPTATSLFNVGNTAQFQVTSAGLVLGPAGSASGPTYSAVADPNTGMYLPGSDIIRLATGGADQLSIIANGFVGIGSTTPGFKLAVGGTIAANDFQGTSTPGIGTSTLTHALNIGPTAIGNNMLRVSVPSSGLDISGSESVGGLVNISANTSDEISLVAFNNHTGSSRNVSVVCNNASYSGNCLHVRSAGTATALNVAGAPTGQGLIKAGSDGAGDANAAILSLDASTGSFLGQAMFLKCGTSTTCWNIRDSANTQQITALGTGFLGIGTTSPYARLSVVSPNNSPGIVTNAIFATSTTATSTFAGEVALQKPVKLAQYTVATLPTCNAGAQGYMAYVTDALAPTYLATIAGGGVVVTPVFCNGTNWVAD